MNNVKLPPAVSVVMRSCNEAWALRDTLRLLREQEYDGALELIVCDARSNDGSCELIEAARPAVFRQIERAEYVPGKILNWGITQARHEWVVFLNADATPANRQWLTALLSAALGTPGTGAAFSRQIPRPDCRGVYAHDYERCFGPHRDSARWDHFFSMVSSLVHRPVWEKEPFREDLQYAEDDEWSRRIKSRGHGIVFAEQSVAIHSHNYTPRQAYRRAFGDSRAMAATSQADPADYNLHHTVLLGALADVRRDYRYLKTVRRLGELPFAAVVRLCQRYGRYRGFHAGWKLYGRGAEKS